MLPFQSLSRDSGLLNAIHAAQDELFVQAVSIPQSGFGAFEPTLADLRESGNQGFNPSVGIRGV